MRTQQSCALEMFLALCNADPTWAGALMLGVGLNQAGRALALASLAAGAAGLFLERDDVELRLARREGCCTFNVTSLEEAIRALKNEIRQRRGVTVALSGDPSVWLAEIVARGLQPQAVAFAREAEGEEGGHAATLQRRGSRGLYGLGLAAWPGGLDLDSGLRRAVGDDWELVKDSAPGMTDRRDRDLALMAAGGSQTVQAPEGALRWLRVAPSLFPRALDRAYLRLRSQP